MRQQLKKGPQHRVGSHLKDLTQMMAALTPYFAVSMCSESKESTVFPNDNTSYRQTTRCHH